MDDTNYIIKLHEKADNFIAIEDNMKDEYQFFSKYIDNDNEHKNNMNPGIKECDRYRDIKPNQNNTIEININDRNISYNYSINGAGIYTESDITMTGGTIKGNEGNTSGYGGGVCVYNGATFTMSGDSKMSKIVK